MTTPSWAAGGRPTCRCATPPGDVDMAIMTISDNGSGFKANGESKRHGLGLARRLIEQVRGTAMVNSDHGTVWTIRFPTVLAAIPQGGG
jgi:two-component sensor histidine kinase